MTGDSVSPPTLRIASRTPGMNDVRSVESWRMVSVCPTPPRMTSWWATSPGRRTEWIGTPPPISSAVRAAVPLGASSLRSWCSSMISALGRCRAASTANCIISTAPIAKFGAKNTLPPPASSLSSEGSQPLVPTTACTPARTHARAFSSAVSGRVKSTTTSTSPRMSASATPSAGSARPARTMSSAPSTASQTVWPIRPAAPATPTRITPRPRRRAPARSARERGDVVERDGVDLLDDLVDGEQRHVGEHRGAEPVHPRGRGLEREHHAALDVLLGAGELVGAGRVLTDPGELVGDDLHRAHDVVRPGPEVQADLAGARVRGLKRVDRVREAPLLAHLLEQPRRGRPAEDVVEYPQREAAVVVACDARRAEAQVVLLGLLGHEAHARRL